MICFWTWLSEGIELYMISLVILFIDYVVYTINTNTITVIVTIGGVLSVLHSGFS